MWNMVSSFQEKHELQIFENKVIRKISGPKEDEVNSLGYSYYIMKNFVIYTCHLVL
jgi:hypothetical protein